MMTDGTLTARRPFELDRVAGTGCADARDTLRAPAREAVGQEPWPRSVPLIVMISLGLWLGIWEVARLAIGLLG